MTQARKDAVREYKERPPNRGVYALTCAATGRAWVGSAPNLDAARNRQLFTLEMRGHTSRSLQADWNAHGRDSFSFQVVETLPDDTPDFSVKDALRSALQTWAVRLNAETLLA